ncbi:hypothetical protein V6N11_029676 [Hibiscus sabdariffa]|uniref:Uncharacterized protein n=1 Tax=Hibiscus sabdariffa TaxID=183260 RepID=A0ABR2P7X4_9ROSI
MAGTSDITVQAEFDSESASEFDQFISLLRPVLPSFPYRTRQNLDGLRLEFFNLPTELRNECLTELRYAPELARRHILRRSWGRPPHPKGIIFALQMLSVARTEAMMRMMWAEMNDDEDRGTNFEAHAQSSLRLLDQGVDDHLLWNPDIYKLEMEKEMIDFLLRAKLKPARDDRQTWFKTLLRINSGVLISLIAKSTSNNRQSLPTLTIESLAACCAVVGFTTSLAGQYLSTNKPMIFSFGVDPEVLTQKLSTVSGLATACGFAAGLLLLLPNNLFRGITMATAFAAIAIPMFIKWCCPNSGGAASLPPLKADAEIPSSEGDADAADMNSAFSRICCRILDLEALHLR